MRQQSDEKALLNDDVSSKEYQDSSEPSSALEGYTSSGPSHIDQMPQVFLECTATDDKPFEEVFL